MKVSKSTRRIVSLLLIIAMCMSSVALEVFAADLKTTLSEVDAKNRTKALNYLEKQFGEGSVLYHGLIPGLKKTVIKKNGTVTTCSKMTPQGLTLAGNYIVISAYCNCGQKHNSVLYLINYRKKNDSGSLQGQYKYVTTVILDTTCHVGGIAKGGSYLWVCDSSSESNPRLRGYKFKDIKKDADKAYHSVTAKVKQKVGITPSFMCYCPDNGYLYEGKFEKTSTTTKVYYYSRSSSQLTKKGSFTIKGIKQVQGISIRGGTMLLTASYGKENKSHVYRFNYSETTPVYDKNDPNMGCKTYKLPNMLEACYITPTRTYFLFESAAKAYLNYNKSILPMDNYVAIDNNSLGFTIS